MFNKQKYISLLEQYHLEIKTHFENALIISKTIDDEIIKYEVFSSSVINMCIKYEAMTSDIQSIIYNSDPRYNHPWSNTRHVAEKLNIDISKEYKIAHDAWDIYNTLKHINHQTKIEQHKIMIKYNLKTIYDISKFVLDSLGKLILKLMQI